MDCLLRELDAGGVIGLDGVTDGRVGVEGVATGCPPSESRSIDGKMTSSSWIVLATLEPDDSLSPEGGVMGRGSPEAREAEAEESVKRC